jgi:uroporphyrin-III C-methyltransferase
VTVYLVGAGPGDPGLITAKGLELVRSCDALVYDRLVSSELVAEAPPDALRIARDDRHQREIDELLVTLAREGLDVVRLKGGDPFVFGRGGEEALALAESEVPFEVVPGVSSLAAVPAAAAIPLTHRGVADRVRVLTGHRSAESRDGETVVVFMGLRNLGDVVRRLLADGIEPATPAAVVGRGTLPAQEVIVAPLAELAEAAGAVEAPALIVVGEVVRLRRRLRAHERSSATRSGRPRRTAVGTRAGPSSLPGREDGNLAARAR